MKTENIIDQSASIGSGTKMGHNNIIHENVEIGEDCQIGHNIIIYQGTKIGKGVRIDDNTVIGKLPMKASASAVTKEKELSPAAIGDNCIVGTQVVIYAGCKINSNVLVADLSSIREDVEIGEYTIVGRGVAVENKCTVGKRCKLETNAYITALSEIGDFVFISPNVTFTNDNFMGRTKERFKYHKGVTIKTGGRVGANSTVLPGITIHEDALVAAGSVVTKDVPSEKIVLGSPAKVWNDVPEEQLLKNQ
jgi:UDP-2-acetamido-3-amino-2,3-dideoxy-glucuronate N-acetyltransferase